MKYIQAATERMQAESATGSVTMDEPSLLERVLKAGNSEKLACIMALDLILVGIDTVSGWVGIERVQLFNEMVYVNFGDWGNEWLQFKINMTINLIDGKRKAWEVEIKEDDVLVIRSDNEIRFKMQISVNLSTCCT